MIYSKQQPKTNKLCFVLGGRHKGIIYNDLLHQTGPIIMMCTIPSWLIWTKETPEKSACVLTRQCQNTYTYWLLKWHSNRFCYSSYSSDTVTTNFFCIYRTYCNENNGDLDAVKLYLGAYLSLKPVKVYADGIVNLSDRWVNVTKNNGNYFIE